MNAVAASPKMQLEATFIVRNVRACDFEDAKEVAKRFAHSHLFGRTWQAAAKREPDGLYTVEFR
jgi:hypothetical protein